MAISLPVALQPCWSWWLTPVNLALFEPEQITWGQTIILAKMKPPSQKHTQKKISRTQWHMPVVPATGRLWRITWTLECQRCKVSWDCTTPGTQPGQRKQGCLGLQKMPLCLSFFWSFLQDLHSYSPCLKICKIVFLKSQKKEWQKSLHKSVSLWEKNYVKNVWGEINEVSHPSAHVKDVWLLLSPWLGVLAPGIYVSTFTIIMDLIFLKYHLFSPSLPRQNKNCSLKNCWPI